MPFLIVLRLAIKNVTHVALGAHRFCAYSGIEIHRHLFERPECDRNLRALDPMEKCFEGAEVDKVAAATTSPNLRCVGVR